jgi:hypothetical protein
MLLRDVAFFSSKVMGDRFDNAKLVIAARRKPVVQDSNKKQ